jgi:hypothetical protein
MENWIDVNDYLPEVEDYYKVKFKDGSEDEKPFRIRPKKNIYGFMTEKPITHWSIINDDE